MTFRTWILLRQFLRRGMRWFTVSTTAMADIGDSPRCWTIAIWSIRISPPDAWRTSCGRVSIPYWRSIRRACMSIRCWLGSISGWNRTIWWWAMVPLNLSKVWWRWYVARWVWSIPLLRNTPTVYRRKRLCPSSPMVLNWSMMRVTWWRSLPTRASSICCSSIPTTLQATSFRWRVCSVCCNGRRSRKFSWL